MRQHYQVGGALQNMPWGENQPPWEREDGTVDTDLRDVYETNEPIILARDEPGPIVSTYNFPVDNLGSLRTRATRLSFEPHLRCHFTKQGNQSVSLFHTLYQQHGVGESYLHI